MGKVELCEHSRVDSSSKGFPWDCSEGRDEGSRYLLNGRPTRGASSCCMLATFKLSFEHEKWILDGCPKPAPVSVIKWPAKNASPPLRHQ